MALPPHAADWMSRAEIDYIGPFVKAWAAFNAWYRHDSGRTQERAMLEYVKSQPNTLRQGILPLLDNGNATADAVRLKQAVCDLQRGLDDIQLEVTRNGVIEQISLRTVCIRLKHLQQEHLKFNDHEFKAVQAQGGAIEITVTSLHTGKVKFQHTQAPHDSNAVYTLPDFANLSESMRRTLRRLYDDCNPRPLCDLVQGNEPAFDLSDDAVQVQQRGPLVRAS